jgi:hypothetical protein
MATQRQSVPQARDNLPAACWRIALAEDQPEFRRAATLPGTVARSARDLVPDTFVSSQITIKVGHRPGRNEPRANKRRPKILQLLTKPRHEAKAELESAA